MTPGVDTVTYGTPYTGGAAISVTLDDAANDNDGMGNVTDNVGGDCERIIGTANGDTINAAAADQGVQLFGRLGGDTLTGSGFDDLLNGEDGTDAGDCGAGTDTAISIETPTACETQALSSSGSVPATARSSALGGDVTETLRTREHR